MCAQKLELEQRLESETTTVPCQYWWDDKWYDLTTFNGEQSFFTTDHTTSQAYAAFNYCQKLDHDAQAASGLGCS